MTRRIRVGVVRGGPSSEHEVSRKTGATVLRHLNEERYEPIDIFIDQEGLWHMHGVPVRGEQLIRRIDVAFNALHGSYGEDGRIQRDFEQLGVPHTGSGVVASAIAMHKGQAKERFRLHDIVTPEYALVRTGSRLGEEVRSVFRSLPSPYVVKPAAAGSSLGVTIARTFSELERAVRHALEHGVEAIVEHLIVGREATVGVLEDFRGEQLYTLPPVEIIPSHNSPFFDYDAKYGGTTQKLCPGNFSREVSDELQAVARRVHQALGLRHYSRTDFIVHPKELYVLEVNTLPGLTEESLLPKAVDAVGSTFTELIEHLIALALKGR